MSRQSLFEHEDEPVRGIPGHLPANETLLWQGSPAFWPLARSLHVRGLACYFAVLVAARGVFAWDGDVASLAMTLLPLIGASILALALLTGFAWLAARTTVYSLTDRRVVLRYGVALSKAVNIPFNLVVGASLRAHADGTGDIPLRLEKGERLPYLMMWPHVRPWRTAPVQPMLRAIPQAALVAHLLSRALAQATGGQVETFAPARTPARAPAMPADGRVAA